MFYMLLIYQPDPQEDTPMREMKFQSGALKRALNVFFKDALRVAFTNPADRTLEHHQRV